MHYVFYLNSFYWSVFNQKQYFSDKSIILRLKEVQTNKEINFLKVDSKNNNSKKK